MTKDAFVNATLMDYNGIRWIMQHDGYRALLGDVLTNRQDAGRALVGHLLGKGAFAYVDLAGKKRLNPNFKVQDVSKTGIEITVGYNIPFQSGAHDGDYGLNVVGTSKFFKGVNS